MRLSKLLLLFVVQISMVNNKLFAYDIETDGFYFKALSPTTLEVTYGEKKYEGELTVPEKVIYNGKTLDVVSVGYKAFEACERLTSINMGSNIKKIGARAFYGCSSLKSYSFNTGNIGSYAFAYCTSIESADLRITDIPEGLFFCCTSLSSFSTNASSIRSNAFAGCTALKNLRLSCYVYNNAFKDCTGIISLEITATNYGTILEEDAFAGCTSIKKLTLKTANYATYGYIDGLSKAVFLKCPNIEEVDVDDYKKITYSDGALYTSSYNKKCLLYILPKYRDTYVAPNDLYSIKSGAIPKQLKRIVLTGENIFVEKSAFANCSDLKEMYLYNKLFCFYFAEDGQYYSSVSERDFNENLIGKLKVFIPYGFFSTTGYPLSLFILEEYDVLNFDPYTLGIKTITNDEEEVNSYSLDGRILSTPSKGFNIIKKKDGTGKKVLVK